MKNKHLHPTLPGWIHRGAEKQLARLRADIGACTCYLDCRQDSHSGTWHQHENEPCPTHPNAEVVG